MPERQEREGNLLFIVFFIHLKFYTLFSERKKYDEISSLRNNLTQETAWKCTRREHQEYSKSEQAGVSITSGRNDWNEFTTTELKSMLSLEN